MYLIELEGEKISQNKKIKTTLHLNLLHNHPEIVEAAVKGTYLAPSISVMNYFEYINYNINSLPNTLILNISCNKILRLIFYSDYTNQFKQRMFLSG